MSGSLLEAAFAHHVWATVRVIDACLELSDEELQTSVLGTRGPMLDTLRHVVLNDAFELFILTGDRAFDIDQEDVSLPEARAIMECNGSGWAAYISRPLDPDETVHEVDETDGFQRWAPLGFRLAGALQHGTDHRSQVCTALTTLGIEPPAIEVWDLAREDGRMFSLESRRAAAPSP
jgi:uncharacterized damage-inducible protein DinB